MVLTLAEYNWNRVKSILINEYNDKIIKYSTLSNLLNLYFYIMWYKNSTFLKLSGQVFHKFFVVIPDL